jgi:hypothetical protein
MSGTLSYVREEGDLSCFPTLPHDLGVTELLHADSPFLKGTIPRNVTQKDFIRKAVGLKPNLTDYAVRVKRRNPKQRLADATFADEALHAQIHQLKQNLGRGGDAECPNPATAAARMLDDATGPRPHATTVMESEGVRGALGARQTSFLAQQLAQHSTAPLASKPTPYHHFMFGGSKTQKRRLERKANQLQATAQANVQLKKQQLVDHNLAVLAHMSAAQEMTIAAGAAGTAPIVQAAATEAVPDAATVHEPEQSASSTSAAPSVSPSPSPSAVAVSAGLGAAAVIAIVFALVRNRKGRKARG